MAIIYCVHYIIRLTAVPYQDIQIQIPWLLIYHPSAHAPEPEDRAVAYSRWNCHLEEPCLETPWDIYPPSLYELRRGRLAISPYGKPQGILAKANE